jgi:hypothetical protein
MNHGRRFWVWAWRWGEGRRYFMCKKWLTDVKEGVYKCKQGGWDGWTSNMGKWKSMDRES